MFFEKGPKGGWVISDPKNYIADFLVLKRYILVVNFGKNVQKGGRGGVISNPKNFIANLRKLTHIYKFSQKKAQCNFRKWGEGGGGQGPFGSFPKKHPVWEIQSPLIYNHPAAQSAVTALAITSAGRIEKCRNTEIHFTEKTERSEKPDVQFTTIPQSSVLSPPRQLLLCLLEGLNGSWSDLKG